MTKKNIINLVAAFTFSTLAFGSVAHAGVLTQEDEAQFSVMKKNHIETLSELGNDIINLETQVHMMNIHEFDLGAIDLLETQVDNKKAQVAQEIALFHKIISSEFGTDVAKNIYTHEQIAQFEKAREKYKQANS